ncbi:hypothetical protein K461DRAFT_43680 [Myriangium duriaei CBS 260.36]|uniref:Uncharacterized protein n=1 Tax=Myriangium duriaei CBS 260.36 TaxID=1168546 RepID=A0A9P4IX04_9PEZI|nr:hypothetical protein K461DRAFT_43680 [Myriangium duriaei CBS 260.36]
MPSLSPPTTPAGWAVSATTCLPHHGHAIISHQRLLDSFNPALQALLCPRCRLTSSQAEPHSPMPAHSAHTHASCTLRPTCNRTFTFSSADAARESPEDLRLTFSSTIICSIEQYTIQGPHSMLPCSSPMRPAGTDLLSLQKHPRRACIRYARSAPRWTLSPGLVWSLFAEPSCYDSPRARGCLTMPVHSKSMIM